jgi:hypothetical protein
MFLYPNAWRQFNTNGSCLFEDEIGIWSLTTKQAEKDQMTVEQKAH